MKHWKRNLIVIWLAQFLTLMGFAFAMPFAPFYLQELGVTQPAQLKVWVALFAAVAPLTLAIFSPIWGHLADRYGRRPMLLRATLGAIVVLSLMGMAQSPQALVFYRSLQGVLTGPMTAAQTMVSVSTPQKRSGFALGALSAAVFGGTMAGNFFGGMFAEAFGCRNAFFAAALFLLAATLLILFGSREDFVRPTVSLNAEKALKDGKRAENLGVQAVTILFLIVFTSGVRMFDLAWLPLLVEEIHGSLEGSIFLTGVLGAAGCIAGILAGFLLGRLTDRVHASTVAKFAALGAGLLAAPQGLAHSFAMLLGARFIMILFSGGLDPVFQIWLARVTREERRGVAFGWAGTARAVGWLMAPLVSGMVALGFGLRSVFFLEALLFLLLIPCVNLAVKRIRSAGN